MNEKSARLQSSHSSEMDISRYLLSRCGSTESPISSSRKSNSWNLLQRLLLSSRLSGKPGRIEGMLTPVLERIVIFGSLSYLAYHILKM